MRWLKAALAAALLALAGAVAAGTWAWNKVHAPFRGYAGESATVEVEPGTGAATILRRLETDGVIADAALARAYLVWMLDEPYLKAGEYRFEGELTTPEVLERLIAAEVVTYPVTVIEGLTLEETARHLADVGFGSYEAFLAEMRSPERIAELDPEAEDLEGYLFPDTYAFARGTAEAEIVSTLVSTFVRRVRSELPADPIAEEGRLRRIVTLASIVEKEAALAEERPTIAGVFANRLRIGMALGADPTVIFALKRNGTWDGNIRRSDLQVDSPYNTYRYPGLPPGPICSPGLAALQAAAAPADVPFLYFVSRNDGSHVFSRTLSEHNRNVERWQRQYWRERWARERAAQGPG